MKKLIFMCSLAVLSLSANARENVKANKSNISISNVQFTNCTLTLDVYRNGVYEGTITRTCDAVTYQVCQEWGNALAKKIANDMGATIIS